MKTKSKSSDPKESAADFADRLEKAAGEQTDGTTQTKEQVPSDKDAYQGIIQDRIKAFAEKILQLRDGEPLPPLKVSGTGKYWENDKNLNAKADSQANPKRAYCNRVEAVLGENADDWLFIKRTFRDLYPEFFKELQGIRKEIFDHTDLTGKHSNGLEPREDNNGKLMLGPNKNLRSKITLLADELLNKAEQVFKETADRTQPAVPQASTPGGGAGSGKMAGTKQQVQEHQNEQEQSKHPIPITLKVAVAEFKVSRSALMRAIGDGTLKSYRPPDASQTAEHSVDAVEVARRWQRRR